MYRFVSFFFGIIGIFSGHFCVALVSSFLSISLDTDANCFFSVVGICVPDGSYITWRRTRDWWTSDELFFSISLDSLSAKSLWRTRCHMKILPWTLITSFTGIICLLISKFIVNFRVINLICAPCQNTLLHNALLVTSVLKLPSSLLWTAISTSFPALSLRHWWKISESSITYPILKFLMHAFAPFPLCFSFLFT